MRGSRTAALSIITLTGATVMLAGCSGGDDSSSAISGDVARDQVGTVEPGGVSDLSVGGDAVGAKEGTRASGNGLLSEVQTDRAVIATAEMTLRSQDVTAVSYTHLTLPTTPYV